MATINTINVGGIDKEIEDTYARTNISNEVTRLENRIDAIIAPPGGAPSAEEVEDARVGYNGTIYNSLGNSIRGQVEDLMGYDNTIKLSLSQFLTVTGSNNLDLAKQNSKSVLWLYLDFGDDETEAEFWNDSHTYGSTTTTSRNIGLSCVLTAGKMDFYWYNDDHTYIGGNKAFELSRNDQSAIQREDDTILYVKDIVLDGYSATLYILVDWSKTVVNSSKVYNCWYDKDFIPRAKRICKLFKYSSEMKLNLQVNTNNGYVEDQKKSFDRYPGFFMNPDGMIRDAGDTSSKYILDAYPVSKGDIVVWNEKQVIYNPDFITCIIGFSEQSPVAGQYAKVIVTSKSEAADYNGVYFCNSDGFIYVCSNRLEKIINLYSGQSVKDNLEYDSYPIELQKSTQTYEGYAISSLSTIVEVEGRPEFVLYKYPVTSGIRYLFYSDYYKLNADNYHIASFSTSDFREGLIVSPIFVETDRQTYKPYHVDFVAPSDGYVYIARALTNESKEMKFSESIIVPTEIFKYLGVGDKTIKMQMFGDSTTDESWRTDKTQWSTLFTKYIPQYSFDLTNSAIGGSRIGHGRVNQNRKYPELTYNYCYDLITNDTVLKKDSDIITLTAGTNDWANSTPLGSLGDETTDTFYGSIKLICGHIMANTKALFIVTTPLNRNYETDRQKPTDEYGRPLNSAGKTLRDYCDALLETCRLYGVPVVDLNYEIGWSSLNIDNFTQDGLHPNPEGSDWIARVMASKIKEHLGL